MIRKDMRRPMRLPVHAKGLTFSHGVDKAPKDACCSGLARNTGLDKMIAYNASFRFYGIRFLSFSAGQVCSITYCPWCGSELPKDLSDELCRRIKDECGVQYIHTNNLLSHPKVPDQYKTEKWWRDAKL